MLLDGRTRNQGSISSRGKDAFSTGSRPALGPTQWLVGPLSPRVNWPRRETNQSLPSSAEIKSTRCYTSVPPHIMLWRLIKHRENFILTDSTCKERLHLLTVYSVNCFASWSEAENPERLHQLKVSLEQTPLAATEQLRIHLKRPAAQARLAGTRRRTRVHEGDKTLRWLTSYETRRFHATKTLEINTAYCEVRHNCD